MPEPLNMECNNVKPQFTKLENGRRTAEEMDESRHQNVAYEYLCHLEETKVWLQACIKEELPSILDLEESLRNGVYLARLAHFFAPNVVPLRKIFDLELRKYTSSGLHFRHTDNINFWLKALKDIGLPTIFYPETTDIYERKNMPRAIYCLHALSLYLFKLGKAPQIQDLYGKINFTDEEINAMNQELQKYGISMPQFQKIGGILASEMPVDEATMHAAIIAINEAVEKQAVEDTLLCLKNPSAVLQNIVSSYSSEYQKALYEAKNLKVEAANNKSIDGSYVADVYDELLTQAEIQGHINTANVLMALDAVQKSVTGRNVDSFMKALKSSALNIKKVKEENGIFYMNELCNKISAVVTCDIDKEVLQNAVFAANLAAEDCAKREAAVTAVNKALESGIPEDTLMALGAPVLDLPSVQEFAAPLYHEEMRVIRECSENHLTYDEIVGGVRVLTVIAAINNAVLSRNGHETWRYMSSELYIQDLEPTCKQRYQIALFEHLEQKKRDSSSCPLLTHLDIQECVDEVNSQFEEDNNKIMALHHVNEAVKASDKTATLKALQHPSLALVDVISTEASHYFKLLQLLQQQKSEAVCDGEAELWLEDLQDCVNTANGHAMEAEKVCAALAAVNLAIDQKDMNYIFQSLSSVDDGLQRLSVKCKIGYQKMLQHIKKKKEAVCQSESPWIAAHLKERHLVYLNLETMEHSWEAPEDSTPTSPFLNKEEIIDIVASVNSEFDKKMLYEASEGLIIKLQALIRGYLTRKQLQERFDHFLQNMPAILRIQAWWHGVQQRRRYQHRIHELKCHSQEATVIQSSVRMWITRKKYSQLKDYYKKHEDKIIKLQAGWRSWRARHDFQALINSQDPPLAVVQRFLHLLDVRNEDFEEELQLQAVKGDVVKAIRHNHQLDQDLDRMDIKIGLLVQNRITLQDVMAHGMKLNQKTKDRNLTTEGAHNSTVMGWKTLTKGRREKLDAYQHILYLLQTNPTYLAKLIFAMPQGKTNKFMESVILTLYNYGSNPREEYLLLRLFKTALEEEIRCKVDKINDIICGNPMVIKMIVSFNRNGNGQRSLRDMLGPLVRQILDDKNLQINTNPVDVYKSWVNQMESQTGQPSGLPYTVNQEQSLQHKEVQEQLKQSLQNLKQTTLVFLHHILHARDKIPYGMLYMSKVLRNALMEKFPEIPEKDILKVVGNLLYYRFINSAIVAPDAFDIVNVSAEKSLTSDQRRNLGSIAKILQFAASKKGFGEESTHLTCLNPFIIECHEKFKKFFDHCCDVEEPEVHFNVDQYYEATLIAKPSVYITVQELCYTHQLLLDHEDTIAPDPEDPLHELLEDLGNKPSISALLGACDISDETVLSGMGKTEVCLTVCNKFEVEEEDESDAHRLFIKTKQMLLRVLPCTLEDSLPKALASVPTPAQEERYWALVRQCEQTDHRAESNKSILKRSDSHLREYRLPPAALQEKIIQNLHRLELAGYVRSSDGYQSIISSIARDIRNHRRYRNRRKQELQRLREIRSSLELKTKFYEDQVDYYNQYIRKCLENLSAGKKKVHLPYLGGKQQEKVRSKAAVRYSAAKLHEKGIVLEIEGLPSQQFKNVMFELCPTETEGVFEIHAKFMGVGMEKVDIDIQHLLQLQYEGVAVINMFGKAKINVNLLLFLLNSKFYGKTK